MLNSVDQKFCCEIKMNPQYVMDSEEEEGADISIIREVLERRCSSHYMDTYNVLRRLEQRLNPGVLGQYLNDSALMFTMDHKRRDETRIIQAIRRRRHRAASADARRHDGMCLFNVFCYHAAS